MAETRIIKAVFGASKSVIAPKRYKNDYGQEIEFVGINLPDVFEAHFSNSKSGQAKKQIGQDGKVLVPDEYFVSGADVFCWVMVHDEATDGRTMYTVRIPVMDRPGPIDVEPTPVQQDIIAETITALNGALDRAEASESAWENMRAESSTLDPNEPATASYEGGVLSLGIPKGEKGDKGDRGEQGIQGIKGDKGDTGAKGDPFVYSDFTPEQLASLKGEKGDKGDTGIQGVQGERGEKGDTGAQGIQGEKGEKGDTGEQGIQGEKGDKGDKGDTGETGPKGDQGDDYILTQQDKADIAGLVDVPVDDVQINGTSIVTDGVANVPIGGTSNFGVFKVNSNYGTGSNNGTITISAATSAGIKNGANGWTPLTPARQHESTFYGLAKIAGADEKYSTLSAGQYTEEAKIAIQKMLGIYGAPFQLIRTITTVDGQTEVYISTDENGEPFELTEAVVDIRMVRPANNANGFLIINEQSKPSSLSLLHDTIPNLVCENLFNSGSNRRNVEYLKIVGGRFFGQSTDGAMISYDQNGNLKTNVAAMGIVELDKIRTLLLCTINNNVFGTGTIVTVYGR